MNLLTEQIDVVKPLPWYRDSVALTDVDLQYLILYLDENYQLSTDKRIDGIIKVAANEYRRHPIREYLARLQWDGQESVITITRCFCFLCWEQSRESFIRE